MVAFATVTTTSFTINEAKVEIARTFGQIIDSRRIKSHTLCREPILYLAGQPGIGKTFIVKQAAKDAGFSLYTLIGASLLSEDVGGQPIVTSTEDGFAVAFSPSMIVQEVKALRRKTGKPVVLFLDEASRIAPDVQAPLLSFIQFRGIHGHYLPNDTIIIMAGNREDDDGGGIPLLAPMINRVHIMNLVADPKEWARWAMGANEDQFPTPLHPLVAATLMNYPGQTSPFAFDPSNGSLPFGSPRSWEAVNDYIVYQEHIEQPCDIRRIAAMVGQQNATVLAAQAKFMEKLVPAADILADPLGVEVHTDPTVACLQILTLTKAIKTVADVNAAIDYCLRPDPNNPASNVPRWMMFLGLFAEGLVRAITAHVKDPKVNNPKSCQYIPFLQKYAVGGAGLLNSKKKLL